MAPITTSKDFVTEQDVKGAIVQAAMSTGWTIQESGPGALLATKTQKDQTAVVKIGYRVSTYSILYQESRNLKYQFKPLSDMGGTIHDPRGNIDKKYNEWVQGLDQAIQKQLGEMR